ncbi:MAG: wax ester/triacylglycerol synthase family O-acyltransferase [Acidimicrobiia bacterium]|nr:wax ester/triacylglycerol synthase family O-acyltransferase [Acidimicrobiia bacterium]
MQQLTGLDASFLNLETSTQHGHVAGVVILDPSTAPNGFDFETLRELIASRIHLLPPFRRKLVEVPLGLDHPYWIEDPEFDLDFHVRHIAVPPPGDYRQLAEQVARIHARPLDRSRPLWELYLIEGLEDGRVATFTKLHHAAIDGVSGAEILTILLDADPDGRDLDLEDRWRPDRMPGQFELLARTGFQYAVRPLKALKLARSVARSVPVLAGAIPRRRSDVLSRPGLVAPHTRLNDPITAHRRFAFADVELARIKAIKNAAEVTVNDVVIALCAGAVRRWLDTYHEVPERSLQAMVPISIRSEHKAGAMGNEVSVMIASIGTHLDDPLERLAHAHESMNVAKNAHNATPATLLQDFAQFAPPAVAARAARLVFRNGRAGRMTPFNMVISNIPGPNFPLYLAGARLEGHYPVSAIVEGMAVNITLHSYLGNLCFGIVADREIVSDTWELMQFVTEEVDVLEEALDLT